MKAHVEFRSDDFPAFYGDEEEINQGRWGKRLAQYLKAKLRHHDIETDEMYAEDWGWVLPVRDAKFGKTIIGLGNYQAYDNGFLIFISQKRTVLKKIFGPSDTGADEVSKVSDAIDRILREDEKITDIRWWTEEP